MSRPRILVTNDDGYRSKGIGVLAAALSSLGDVLVVAPDGDRSGIGHALSIKHPVHVAPVRDAEVKTFRATGTPADCVVIGALDLFDERPDLVVSGINRGANLGDDVNYSGTVAAAIESVLVGVPSIAISLAYGQSDAVFHWDTAANVAVSLAKDVLEHGLPPLDLLNVNVPNVPHEALRGVRWVRQGRKSYDDRIDRRSDPRGGTYYWIWGTFDRRIEEGTDLAAIRDGYASITPVSIDRTDEALLETRGASQAYTLR